MTLSHFSIQLYLSPLTLIKHSLPAHHAANQSATTKQCGLTGRRTHTYPESTHSNLLVYYYLLLISGFVRELRWVWLFLVRMGHGFYSVSQCIMILSSIFIYVIRLFSQSHPSTGSICRSPSSRLLTWQCIRIIYVCKQQARSECVRKKKREARQGCCG